MADSCVDKPDLSKVSNKDLKEELDWRELKIGAEIIVGSTIISAKIWINKDGKECILIKYNKGVNKHAFYAEGIIDISDTAEDDVEELYKEAIRKNLIIT